METSIRHRIRVTGVVQGVAFRPIAKKTADALDITGFARNNPDGSVAIEAQGRKIPMGKFMEWVHHGPEKAKVDAVEFETIPVRENEGRFEWN